MKLAKIVVSIVLLLIFVFGGCQKALDDFPQTSDVKEVDSAHFYIEVREVNYNRNLPYLEVLIKVRPSDIFTQELCPPPVWLVVLSKGGHYFGNYGPLTWTKRELQPVDETERNYYILREARQRRVKSIVIKTIPRTDKDVVNMYSELGGFFYDARLVFREHFELRVVGKEQLIKIRENLH